MEPPIKKHPREMNEAELRAEVEQLRKQQEKILAYVRRMEEKLGGGT
jgi:hypothetical protein